LHEQLAQHLRSS